MTDEDQKVPPDRLATNSLASLRSLLIASLEDENVHAGFAKVFAGVPPAMRGVQAGGQPFTLWQQLEHLRLCLIDFLDYCRVPGYIELKFPEGYWPATDAPPDQEGWDHSIQEYGLAMQQMKAMVLDSSTDLFAPIPGGDGRTVLRQVLAALDHNAYHLGQAVLLLKLLDEWKQ